MQGISTTEQWITAAGKQVYVKQWLPEVVLEQTKAPIILLHDSLGCVALWRDFPQQLCAVTRRRVIAYDRLGFGHSAKVAEKLQADFIQQEAIGTFQAVIQQLGISNFVALGHSVGGGMATVCAGMYAGQCKGLITIAAQAFVEARTLDGIRAAADMFQQEGQMARLEKYHADKAQWVLDAWVHTWLSDAFSDWTLDDCIKQVECPLLVLHGAQDEYGSVAQPQRFAELSRGPVVLHIIPACGHVPQRERPALVLEAVGAFLATLD